jgi:phosphodiesterase/alkaline phosphatase D-like protein
MLAPTGPLQAGSEATVAERGWLGVGVIVPRRALLAIALLSLAIAAALSLSVSREHSSVIPHARRGSPSQKGLPVALRAPVSQALGADTAAYRVSLVDGSLEAANPAQRLRMSFSRSGVRISSGKTQVGLSLHAAGYGSSLQPLGAVSAGLTANRVIYRHRGLSEWFANAPLGLEQGFTVASTPSASGATTLTLSLGLSGNARVAMAPGGQSITLGHRGGPSLRYAGLTATDASGRTLRSWFELRGGEVLLRVDARQARYPLRIDPLFQQAKLTGGEEVGAGEMGFSVALASDGNTALVGALSDNNEVGAAWVFVRSGSTWTQQGPKLTGEHETGAGRFGSSVALSADGNTALIGGEGDSVEVGAAWVFTRSGATWTQQGKKLTGSGEVGTGRFGWSAALSADGNTALIGGPGKFENGTAVGAVWVFTRSGATWSQQGEKLTGTGEIEQGEFGVSAALSADGNTALIGTRLDNASAGAAYLFTRSGGIWTQQGGKLTGAGEIGLGELGESVALSAEGNTALVAGPGDNNGRGAAWVFLRSGSTWSQQGGKLTGNGEVGEGELGGSVALSSNGNIALIGGPADNNEVGAAWLFARSGANWTQQGEKLTAVNEFGKGYFGDAVALSSEATTALIAAPVDSQGVGAAWVFVAPMPPIVETGAASAITETSATLNASVNPAGNEVTECKFEYGTTASYGSGAPCTPAPGSGGAPVAVSASVTGLSENTTYHFRISASHAIGTSKGTDQTLKTLPRAASVGECKVVKVTQTTATLCATVNPNGSEVSACSFEYGPTTSYGSIAACAPAPGSGTSPVEVHAEVSGLSPNTTYHFRVSATNADGTSKGADQTLKTLPNPPTLGECVVKATQTTATFCATVNPNGSEVTECKFEYGTTTSYGSTVPCSPAPGSGTSPVEVHAEVTGLSPNAIYHFRVSVTNAGGNSVGSDHTVKTLLPNAPTPGRCKVVKVTQTSATLCATVNPNGGNVSECIFEYGPTTAYFFTVPCSPSPGSGTSPVEVRAEVTGLSPNTTYHFRVSVTNAGGIGEGADETVKTLPNAPTVKTEAASSIGPTAAILNASVNPNGGNVGGCELEYGTTTAYGSSAPCSPSPGSGESAVAVSAAVGDLSSSTTYHFKVVANNAGGKSEGEDKTLTTLPAATPIVATTAASSLTRTLAGLNGTVNPNGSTVSDCHFEYGPSTSYGSSAPCASLPGSGESAVPATASLGNLSPGATYHFRISATNADGTSSGSDQTFTTLAALPTPHWYKNGTKLPLGETSPLIGWGTLTLESSAATATCHTAEGASVENSGGAARTEVLLLATYECKPVAGNCTGGEARATPKHLPWNGTVLEEGVEGSEEFREEGWGVELSLECFKGGINSSSEPFKTGPVLAEVGTSTPAWLNGTTATKPSELSFDASSGHLYAEVGKAAVKGTTKGKLKFVGYQDNASTPLITLAKP